MLHRGLTRYQGVLYSRICGEMKIFLTPVAVKNFKIDFLQCSLLFVAMSHLSPFVARLFKKISKWEQEVINFLFRIVRRVRVREQKYCRANLFSLFILKSTRLSLPNERASFLLFRDPNMQAIIAYIRLHSLCRGAQLFQIESIVN